MHFSSVFELGDLKRLPGRDIISWTFSILTSGGVCNKELLDKEVNSNLSQSLITNFCKRDILCKMGQSNTTFKSLQFLIVRLNM